MKIQSILKPGKECQKKTGPEVTRLLFTKKIARLGHMVFQNILGELEKKNLKKVFNLFVGLFV